MDTDKLGNKMIGRVAMWVVRAINILFKKYVFGDVASSKP